MKCQSHIPGLLVHHCLPLRIVPLPLSEEHQQQYRLSFSSAYNEVSLAGETCSSWFDGIASSRDEMVASEANDSVRW